MNPDPTPPPGRRYPDPDRPGATRHWDGRAWRDDRPTAEAAAPNTAGAPGFWGRMSWRGKAVIIVDVIVLAAVIAVGAVYLTRRSDGSATASSPATPTAVAPSTTPSSGASAFGDGLRWITAVCGSNLLIEDRSFGPESGDPLPTASRWALCSPESVPDGILIGVYDDASGLDADVATHPGAHRQATRTDDRGRTWLFFVLGADDTPLLPLRQHGFHVT